MIKTPLQKIEDLLRKADLFGKLTTEDLMYEPFPDVNDLSGTKIRNFKKVIDKLFDEEKCTEYYTALDDCIYSVTNENSEEQEKGYQKSKKSYYGILNEVHDRIILKKTD